MRRVFRPFAIAVATTLTLTACQKDTKEAEAAPASVSTEAIAAIKRMGFSTDGVQKVTGGYLVEGDIMLHDADLSQTPTSPNLTIAQEEQYRTFNRLNATKHPTVKIALNISNSSYTNAFTTALDTAIKRYNALNLTFQMQRMTPTTTNPADITIVAYYEKSNTLGSAGFPNSSGDPYNQVRMNTYWYSTATDVTNMKYIGTIMAHELGHCIGFRHTDYMSRRFSCGSGGNEGQSSTGVGAVHIPGTPTKADAGSWMLACIGDNVNRPFNPNDKIALNYLW